MSDYNYVRVRVVRSRFGYNGEMYGAGEELEVHEGALEKHPRTIKRVEAEPLELDDESASNNSNDGDEDGEGRDDEVDVADLDPHPSDLTVSELEARVGEVEDVGLLEAIRDAEESTEDRSTALEAIESRLAELEE